MKPFHRLVMIATILLALSPSLRAEFLVLRIRESTAENISHWIAAFCVLLVVLTLRKSCNKEGRGK